MTILITGSRDIHSKGLELVEHAVLRIIKRGEHIVVGDAPGIDARVIEVANRKKYKKIDVFGAYGKMRHKTDYGENNPLDVDYLRRDVIMAQQCGRCLALWNGESGGTIYTYKRVVELDKPARAIVVDKKTGACAWLQPIS